MTDNILTHPHIEDAIQPQMRSPYPTPAARQLDEYIDTLKLLFRGVSAEKMPTVVTLIERFECDLAAIAEITCPVEAEKILQQRAVATRKMLDKTL